MHEQIITPAGFRQHFSVARTRYDRLMVGHEKRRRGAPGKFNMASKRLAEIGALVRARHGHLPDTNDASIYVDAVVAVTNRSPAALRHWLRTVGVLATLDEAAHIINRTAPLLSRSAAALGVVLRLRWEERQAHQIMTIRAFDVSPAAAAKLRKAKDRERKQAARAAKGAKPHAQAFSRTKPWKVRGISRRTWERKRRKPVTQIRPDYSLAPAADEFASRSERPSPQPSNRSAREVARQHWGRATPKQKNLPNLPCREERLLLGGTPAPRKTSTSNRAEPPQRALDIADEFSRVSGIAALWDVFRRCSGTSHAAWPGSWRAFLGAEQEKIFRHMVRRKKLLADQRENRRVAAAHCSDPHRAEKDRRDIAYNRENKRQRAKEREQDRFRQWYGG
jgi:hypothetical protein